VQSGWQPKGLLSVQVSAFSFGGLRTATHFWCAELGWVESRRTKTDTMKMRLSEWFADLRRAGCFALFIGLVTGLVSASALAQGRTQSVD
jgi:hypothetical protein